jgi:hypothetical protein
LNISRCWNFRSNGQRQLCFDSGCLSKYFGLINPNRVALSYLELYRKALRFAFFGSFSRLVIPALFPLWCGSAAAGPVNYIAQDSVTEALVPTTTRLLFREPLTDDGVHLQLFRLQGEGVEWSPDGSRILLMRLPDRS